MNIKSVYIVLGIESKEISIYKQRWGLIMKKTLSDDGNGAFEETPRALIFGMINIGARQIFFFFFFLLFFS